MKYKKIVSVISLLFLSFVFYSFCRSKYNDPEPLSYSTHTTDKIHVPTPSKDNVTIFIHGTRLNRFFPFYISKKIKLLDEKLSSPKLGLHHVSELPITNNQVKIAHTLNKCAPDQFPLDSFYIFGWSGTLDIDVRRDAAKRLIADIIDTIINPYKAKYGKEPSITIITHSHGGNVALNMARDKKLSFSIENLILLACPVQNQTKRYIQSPLFKNIYSLFSQDDMIQVLDPQIIATMGHKVKKAWAQKSTHPLKSLWNKLTIPFFSKRTFEKTPTMYHVQIGWKDDVRWSDSDFEIYGDFQSIGKKVMALDTTKKRGLRHVEFLIPTFIRQLPTILEQAHSLKKDFTFYL